MLNPDTTTITRVALLNEINTQLEGKPDTPKPGVGPFISLCDRDEQYLQALKGLRDRLLKSRSRQDGVMDLDQIQLPLQSMYYEFPAFSGEYSYYMDLEASYKWLPKFWSQVPANVESINTEMLWKSPVLRSWVRSELPSLAVLHGAADDIAGLEVFACNLMDELSAYFPIACFMRHKPKGVGRYYFTPEDVIRNVVIRLLKESSSRTHHVSQTFKTAIFLSKGRSLMQWMHLLEQILSAQPSFVLLIDLSVMREEDRVSTPWVKLFQSVIGNLRAMDSPPQVRIMILSSRFIHIGPAETLCIQPTRSIQVPVGISNWDAHYWKVHNPFDLNRAIGVSHNESLQPRISTEPETIRVGISTSATDGCETTLDVTQPTDLSTALPQKPKSREDFKIVIFCALSHEADAVEAVFDHYWSENEFGQEAGDKNAYTTGVLGTHNVVLVHMPNMGKISASVAASMCRFSFPSIKVAFLVGICGGVPYVANRKEVILGDIIIADGLVQYDFGRQLPGLFVRKKSYQDDLGRLPMGIRSLLAKLKTIRNGRVLQESMCTHLGGLRKHVDLAVHADYPGVESDILFYSSYAHKHHEPASCDNWERYCGTAGEVCETARQSTCARLRCDHNYAVPRTRLSCAKSSSMDPAIHFGKIASGDKVMRSGSDRDAVASVEDVIAFEMEGAGIWDVFPTVIIKGICDYSDSHKSKEWQRYAAITAAAGLKAFLELWVDNE